MLTCARQRTPHPQILQRKCLQTSIQGFVATPCLRDHVHRPTDRQIDQPTNQPTDQPCPSHSRDTDKLHVPTLPRHTHVNSAVCGGDSYKTENADDGEAKSRDIRATNCEAGTRERPVNLFILALPCRCCHASLGFTYVSFSRWLLHTSPFSHFPT